MDPNVAVILLNFNGLSDTQECLNSLKEVTYNSFTVIVVDNGSERREVSSLREEFGEWIVLIDNGKNYGFAEGNNIGIRRALETLNPDYVLLLNNDTVVDPNFLTELVSVAESGPKIGVVGPKIYYYNEPKKIHFAGGAYIRRMAQPFHIGQDEYDEGQYDHVQETGYITACALLIKRRVVDEIGLLDRDYFIYFEELDWIHRAKQRGYQALFVPDAKVWHKVSSVSGLGTPFYTYFSTRNRILFVRKNASNLDFLFIFLPSFALLRVLGPLLVFLISRNWRAIKALLIGVRDGMANRLEDVERWIQ